MNEYITVTRENKLSALHSQIADLAAQAVTAHDQRPERADLPSDRPPRHAGDCC